MQVGVNGFMVGAMDDDMLKDLVRKPPCSGPLLRRACGRTWLQGAVPVQGPDPEGVHWARCGS
jgi:hypothetical protein